MPPRRPSGQGAGLCSHGSSWASSISRDEPPQEPPSSRHQSGQTKARCTQQLISSLQITKLQACFLIARPLREAAAWLGHVSAYGHWRAEISWLIWEAGEWRAPQPGSCTGSWLAPHPKGPHQPLHLHEQSPDQKQKGWDGSELLPVPCPVPRQCQQRATSAAITPGLCRD